MFGKHAVMEWKRRFGPVSCSARWWLAADFDGSAAMLDALSYLKAARAVGAPVALEVSRSGQGSHAWLFFAGPVPAATARQVGTGLLRAAIALRGRMDLSGDDRLFPSQDVLPTGGVGNLIAAPLQGRCRRGGATVFLDTSTWNRTLTKWHTCRAWVGFHHGTLHDWPRGWDR